MKERLFKNYVTTVVGLLILGVAVSVWVLDLRPIEEIVMIAGYGFIFLRSKDSLIGLPKDDKGKN